MRGAATNFFMSDLANSFYNAWIRVFVEPGQQVYSTWHLDGAWKQKLQACVKDTEIRRKVYAYLWLLRTEPDVAKFLKMKAEFLSYIELHSEPFHDYFLKQYFDHETAKIWATCYRLECITNTNMYAESFHRLLKTIYMHKKGINV